MNLKCLVRISSRAASIHISRLVSRLPAASNTSHSAIDRSWRLAGNAYDAYRPAAPICHLQGRRLSASNLALYIPSTSASSRKGTAPDTYHLHQLYLSSTPPKRQLFYVVCPDRGSFRKQGASQIASTERTRNPSSSPCIVPGGHVTAHLRSFHPLPPSF